MKKLLYLPSSIPYISPRYIPVLVILYLLIFYFLYLSSVDISGRAELLISPFSIWFLVGMVVMYLVWHYRVVLDVHGDSLRFLWKTVSLHNLEKLHVVPILNTRSVFLKKNYGNSRFFVWFYGLNNPWFTWEESQIRFYVDSKMYKINSQLFWNKNIYTLHEVLKGVVTEITKKELSSDYDGSIERGIIDLIK